MEQVCSYSAQQEIRPKSVRDQYLWLILRQQLSFHLKSWSSTFTSLLLVVAVALVIGVGDAPVWLGEELHLASNLDAEVG